MNIVLWNRTKFLSGEFNLFTSYLLINESHRSVVHYVLKKKPWCNIETYIDGMVHPVYYDLFDQFMRCLNLDKKIFLKKESLINKFRRVSKNSFPLSWFVYFKLKKIFYSLLKNSKKVEGADDFLNRIILYRRLFKDPKLVVASQQLMSHWMQQLEKLK